MTVSIIKYFRDLLYRPIRVFVFHHVSDSHNPLICGKSDWTQTDIFFSNIISLKTEYTFISLEDAYHRLSSKKIRTKKYAVLTTDDGLQTIDFVKDQLEKLEVPLTCFINAKYMDGISCKDQDKFRIRKNDANANIREIISLQYLSKMQTFNLLSPNISIASHGFEHLDASQLDEKQFREDIENCLEELKSHPRFVPFHAYPWGRHTQNTDQTLADYGLTPVLVDGCPNRHFDGYIHRECIDGKIIG